MDTSINNVIMTINEKVEQDIRQQVDCMTLQNQSTFCDFKICLNELTTRLDNVTSLVEGMVAGPQPHYEGPPTIPSVFGRLVDPIGKQHPDLHRFPENRRTDVHRFPENGQRDTMVGPAVLQMSVTHPNRGNAPFSTVFRPPEPVEGEIFSDEHKAHDGHVTRRSNSTGVRPRGTQNAERRNPDAILPPTGPSGTFSEPDIARVVIQGLAHRPPPDPDEPQTHMDYSGDLNHTNDGSIIERRWARNMDAVCGQLQAATAQLAVMASGKKHRAAAGAGAGNPGGSSDGSNSSRGSERNRDLRNYSDDDEVVRQGKGNRARRPIVPSLSSSSTSDGNED